LHYRQRGSRHANAATAVLRRLVGGERVACELAGAVTYDHEVGRCTVEGRDLGTSLIAASVCTRCARYDEKAPIQTDGISPWSAAPARNRLCRSTKG
jgi:endonuclease YncB( thermonuclease family)